jgi:hypothetical protein
MASYKGSEYSSDKVCGGNITTWNSMPYILCELDHVRNITTTTTTTIIKE